MKRFQKKIIHSLPDAGADIIEIGIPFSDPMADGPTIQRSSQRAIKSKINLKKIFNMTKGFRKKKIKLLLLFLWDTLTLYFNLA